MQLAEIAKLLGYQYKGNGEIEITHFCTIDNPKKNAIAFIKHKKYLKNIDKLEEIAVIVVTPDVAKTLNRSCLIANNPYLAFSEISCLLSPDIQAEHFVHETAAIDTKAKIGKNVSIGANVVVEAGAEIANDSVIQAGCYIGAGTKIGNNAFLFPNITINSGCIIGSNIRIQSGAVIGSEGFGYAKREEGSWSRIAQTGKVIIGNNVQIGANTTIDRGAIEDTIIADGVILDNQIQIAHNVQIGKNTAMAGCVGVAGSAIIGENCTVGGGAVVLGHINIVDNVHITAMSLVTKSINSSGQYSSGGLLEKSSQWRKNAVRFKQLDKLFKMLKNNT